MLGKQALLEAAADKTVAAAEFSAAALDHAIERITPVLTQAVERMAPLADEALDRAKTAKTKAAGMAADAVEHLRPGLNQALDKVTPAVDRAQRTLQEDLIPQLIETLRQAAGQPTPPPAKRGRVFCRLAKLVALGAALAGVAYAVRAYLAGSKEDTWATHEPRQAYVYPDDLVEAEPTAATAAAAEPEQEDSFIGPNPPEGFTIKANARSKKYHLPGSRGYDRTIAEVWFATPEAAEAAGFVRAQG
ncbi:MAG: hypothetical protein LBK54_11790 [Propionibacteriaceae bacterium]|jgi:hypothetical protein|nr:hypothetical protein [Propionibacteriaceae bacterium]